MFGRVSKNILYVDADGIGCEMLAVWLATSRRNHSLVRATDMADAHQLMARKDFDLFIVDDSFSEATGAELCHELRESGQRSPLVIYTEAREEVDRERAAEAGADAYLIKPDEFALLATTIDDLLDDQENSQLPPVRRSRTRSTAII